ncbi:hypothetical protein GCM10008905_33200 [Clostridium malenominatum]|uniref:Lipoprotein n=1 Tax=Clostridium malenominatum TaxID=1539 RepID=A0ABN1J7P1_9CLOT
MNKDVKRFIASMLLISVIVFFPGCNNKNTFNAQSNNAKSERYSKELLNFFPKEHMGEIHYSGTAEYGETVEIYKITGTEKNLIINLKGNIDKVAEEGEIEEEESAGDKFKFWKEYIIDYESVKEVQKNGEFKKRQEAIEKLTILKLPLHKGNAWEDEVELKGKIYRAKTTIMDIYVDNDGKKLIKTETLIKDIENYPNKTYRETKIFKEGRGLIEFTNTRVFEDKTTFEFSYRMFEIDSK